jgi:thymidylate synthase
MYSFLGINEALVGMSKVLLGEGAFRETRGFRCVEIPHPVTIEIRNPCSRFVTIPERKWNPFLGYAESLWLGLGMNNLDDLTGKYVKSLYNFSDDGKTWRGGYGPRFRYFNGSSEQYSIGESTIDLASKSNHVDQFEFVVKSFEKDPNTRQALITIADPNKDCFENKKLIETKDMPCSRTLHFMRSFRGELDLVVHMRSNDILWGFSAVNVFNFTLMQEYFSFILDLPLGRYYHTVDNFHVYENFLEKIGTISEQTPVDTDYKYPRFPTSLSCVDNCFKNMYIVQKSCLERSSREEDLFYPDIFYKSFFYDWITTLRLFSEKGKSRRLMIDSLSHPQLEEIFSKKE